MQKSPLITVLMPVYNCENYIFEAVESILKQTYHNFELIIIDDCSTDNTIAKIKEFTDDRIHLIQKEKNSGHTNSLNFGLQIAKGKYIARMDGDDISLPMRFEKQVSFLEANEDVVLCGTQYKVIGTEKVCNHPLSHDEIKVKLLLGSYIAHPTVMFKKEFFDNHNLSYNSEMEPAEDYDLWSRVVFLGRVANLKEVLLHYRVHEQQMSKVKNEKQEFLANKIRLNLLKKIIYDLSFYSNIFILSNQVNNKKLDVKLFKENVNFLNLLRKKNNENGVFDSKLFINYIENEKSRLWGIFKDNNIINIITIKDILIFMPLFFLKKGISKIGFFFKNFIFELKDKGVFLLKFFKIEKKIKSFLNFCKDKFKFYYFICSDIILFKQNIDFKQIPIIIISFNQLFYLKKLIDYLLNNGYKNIIVIDNNSSYPPLLNYFQIMESKLTIHRLNENHGHLVFWKVKELYDKYSSGFHVVTDSDIVPDEKCPDDFLKQFIKIIIRNKEITKVGFSLKIDDIPDTNPNKQKVIDWESQFWKNIKKDGNYKAAIDTTFALYKPKYKYDKSNFYDAIRTKEPYCAIHGGWYLDVTNLTDEQAYYFNSCNESSSWRIDSSGKLNTKDYG